MSCLSFLFFRDTFRKERSLLHQKALKSRSKQLPTSTSTPITDGETNVEIGEKTDDPEKGEGDRSRHHSELSLRDLNPIKPICFGLRRLNNLTILFATGKLLFGKLKNTECLAALVFAFEYTVTYAAARTLGSDYGYSPFKIGLVTLAFGTGEYAFYSIPRPSMFFIYLSYYVSFVCTRVCNG